ncbi:MAG: sugar transferase [Ignavibacteriaceae bacterium]|nr:sugar transferase [Ignavibacteriaceae bacterium]
MENIVESNITITGFEKANMISKRLLDIIVSIIILFITIPFWLLISVAIIIESGFPVLFLQERIGINRKPFKIIKFRTMKCKATSKDLLISSHNDLRITNVGRFLRKYKIDELPQFINVFLGDMSIVGPRPEVKKYTERFLSEYDHILSVKPGITDYASIVFRNEAQMLDNITDREKFYMEKILPEKIILNKKYIIEACFITDIKIIFITFWSIFK